MKKDGGRLKRTWHGISRWSRIIVITVVLLLIAGRLALPYAVKRYVNRQLDSIPEYRGEVADIDIQLIRGAYKIKGLKMEKTIGPVPVPFVSIPEMDLSVEWSELWHGAIVGEVDLKSPQVNFVKAPSEAESQTEVDRTWKETLESLFPFTINRFQVRNGDIRFRDFHRTPNVDIYITNLFAVATNLTNSRDVRDELPAGLIARGHTIGGGVLDLSLRMNPMVDTPTFELAAGVTNVNLVALNDFMRAYGKFDVASGSFQLYTEIAAAEGRFEGYVKPFFENLDVFDWDKERKKNVLQKFWQAIVAGVAGIFKNQPHDRLATRIPVQGNFEQTDADIWIAVGGILKNAFVRALLPRLDETVEVEDVKKSDK